MKEHPIIFSAPMVRAILDGRKTQTRRIPTVANSLVDGRRVDSRYFKRLNFSAPTIFRDDGPSPAGNPGPYLHVPLHYQNDGIWSRVYPIYQPGDQLWVKETFRDAREFVAERIMYRANDEDFACRWKPSIFMPRAFSRITLEITRIRVERLQDISEVDAIAEGCEMDGDFPKEQPIKTKPGQWPGFEGWDSAEDWYADLWDSGHGEGAWEKNPWVWVVEFARV
jgi:hypothetical protein